MADDSTALTLASFADRVGERFALIDAAVPTEWTLIEAEPFDVRTDPFECRRFSLVFRGAPEPIYEQQAVSLRHPDIGEHTIFIVPIGQDRDGVSYQAIFN